MIGYEFEFLIREGIEPLTKPTFLKIHKELEKDGWAPSYDAGTKKLIGSKKNGIYVTIDDAVGIMEINAPPTKTIQESDKQIRKLLSKLQEIYKKYGCSIFGLSAFPGSFENPKEILCDKSFIIKSNLRRFPDWKYLLAIASNHVWLDVEKEKILEVWKTYNRLTPILIALFSNGPIFNEKNLGILDGRDRLWKNMLETSNVGNESWVFGMPEKEFSTLSEYFKFILKMKFYFLIRDGKGVVSKDSEITFGEYFHSTEIECIIYENESVLLKPNVGDFLIMQNITFPHARIKYKIKDGVKLNDMISAIDNNDDLGILDCFDKTFLECRAIGAQPIGLISAPSAFLLGLLENFDKTKEMLNQIEYEQLRRLFEDTVKNGLEARFEKLEVFGLATDLLEISKEGLIKRGLEEEEFLKPVEEIIQNRKNPAQKALEIWKKDGLKGLYENRDFGNTI